MYVPLDVPLLYPYINALYCLMISLYNINPNIRYNDT